MKTLIIILFVALIPFSGKAYNWNLLGPDSINVTNICFGAAMPYMVFCTDDGMYLYNYSTYETTFHTNGYLPIQGAVHLTADKMLVVMGDGSWSDGIWTFDIQTLEFEVVEWIPNPAFLIYNDQNQTYYAGFHFGGLYTSTDGLAWTEVSYFSGKSCECICYYGDHMAVSEVSNIYNIHWSDDGGESWYPSSEGSPIIADLNFSQEGKLFGIFPDYSNSSGLWYSDDYGNTWDVEFWSDNMSAVGFDVFGHIFVGWESPTSGNEGIAYYNPDASPPGLNYYNIGLGNLNINKIKTNPTMSAPALFVCTDGGVYMTYDLVVETNSEMEGHTHFSISPNPVPSNGLINISLPETFENIQIQLFCNSGDLTYEAKLNNTSSNQNFQIQLPDVSAGVYYCRLKLDSGSISKKLVIN